MPGVLESVIQLQAALRVWKRDDSVETLMADSALKRLLPEVEAAISSKVGV